MHGEQDDEEWQEVVVLLQRRSSAPSSPWAAHLSYVERDELWCDALGMMSLVG